MLGPVLWEANCKAVSADTYLATTSDSRVEIVVSAHGKLLIFLWSDTYSTTKFRLHLVKYSVSGRLFTSLWPGTLVVVVTISCLIQSVRVRCFVFLFFFFSYFVSLESQLPWKQLLIFWIQLFINVLAIKNVDFCLLLWRLANLIIHLFSKITVDWSTAGWQNQCGPFLGNVSSWRQKLVVHRWQTGPS